MLDYVQSYDLDSWVDENILNYTNICFKRGRFLGAPEQFYVNKDMIHHICENIIDINSRECHCEDTYKKCRNSTHCQNICSMCNHDMIKCNSLYHTYNIYT